MRLKSVTRNNKSVYITLPSPINGLNKRDNLMDMDVRYAAVMDNYIPQDTKVVLRSGYAKYADFEAPVETLASYVYGAEKRFFAVSGKKIWDITHTADVQAILSTGISADRFRYAQYKNYLFFVNGIDTPKAFYVDSGGIDHIGNWGFSGSGLTAGNIVNVSVSKQRLWFVEKDSLKVWYPEVAGNISGTLHAFDLAQVCRYGGNLVAVADWTQDGGQGIDDLTAFITSEGEVLIYSGSDIEDADDWKLRGSYKISKPIGYECCLQYQGDVVIITEDGYIPLSKALPLDQSNTAQVAFSDCIRGLVIDRTQKYGSRAGWQGIIYSRGGYGLFNVPVANSFEQHVINVNTGAWCRFTGIRSYCWCNFDRRLYFGSDNAVYLFDEGYTDNGAPICGVVEQAYNNLGTERLKKVQMLNPRTKSSAPYSLAIYTNMDMEEQSVDYVENIGSSGLHKWNEMKWSAVADASGARWSNSGRTVIRSQWIVNSATGYKAGIVFKTKTRGNQMEWYETGVCYEMGEGIL